MLCEINEIFVFHICSCQAILYSINSMLARYAERQKYFQITNTETEVYLSVTYAQRPESWFRVMKMFSATVLTR